MHSGPYLYSLLYHSQCTSPTQSKQELISLVESMCEVQDRMLGARIMPKLIQKR